MIGSPYFDPEPSPRGRTTFWVVLALGVALFAALFVPGLVHAASLRVCVADNPSPDIATAPVYLNTNPFYPDLLVGSIVVSGKRCNLLPIPATLARGTTFTTTVTYRNAVGEESAPSNGVPFRNPGAPPVPVLDSVQILAP